jgi:hypothetical protein
MYDWVRALLDPTDIVQSPSSAKKQITPPPKFDLPEDDHTPSQRSRSRRSVSPSKKTTSPRKSRTAKSAKDVPSTPSTAAANSSLQEALSMTASMESDGKEPKLAATEEVEVKTTESPKKKGRKSKKAAAEADEEKGEEEKEAKKEEKEAKKEEKKEEKKTEKKKKAEATPKGKTSQTTVSLDMPISLPEVPTAAETEEMIAKAKEMVADAVKGQTERSSSAKVTKKRKPEEEDEETAAEAAQRVKKAKVLEDKLKRERVRNRALFGVSAAFALA